MEKKYEEWTTEQLRKEAEHLRRRGYAKAPDYAGVDKYDGFSALQERAEGHAEYLAIQRELARRTLGT